jgi:hypothetical protein
VSRPRLRALAAVTLSLGALAALGATLAAAAPPSKAHERAKGSPAAPALPAAALEGVPEAGGIEVGPALPAPPPPSKGEEVEAGKASHPGFFDVGGKIEQAINDWFAGLVKDALNPAMLLVGRTLLSTPQIAGESEVRSYWQLSLGIADALLVLVVMVAGATLMHHETLQSSYALKDFLPRLLIAGIATNASLAISGQMVAFANLLSGGLLGNGVNPEQAGHTLELLVFHAIRALTKRSGEISGSHSVSPTSACTCSTPRRAPAPSSWRLCTESWRPSPSSTKIH